MRRSLAILLLEVACLCLVIQGVARAQQDGMEKMRGGHVPPTALELSRLPPVCTAKRKYDLDQGSTNLEKPKYDLDQADTDVNKWRNILGSAFIHMHHYCNGLNFLNRIDLGIGNRGYLLGLALNEFRYVQLHAPADNVVQPDVEFYMGMVLYRADSIPQAIGQLLRAIQMKPDYERAYLLLSFCYLRLGDRASAADALQKGLNKVPDSRALRDALNEMNTAKKEPDGLRYR